MSQRNLFGFENKPLIRKEVLERFRDQHKLDPISNQAEIYNWIKSWITSFKKDEKETTLEQSFNSQFFGDILSYTLYPGEDNEWTAWPKPSTRYTGLRGEPDLLLGDFGDDKFNPYGVVELKKPGTNLDAPQKSYNNKSPVEQAFEYAENLESCRWVIVSDMLNIRLYAVDDIERSLRFNLQNCIDITNDSLNTGFKDLFLLIRFDSLIKGGLDSSTSRIVSTSNEEQVSFQEGFYSIYSEIRVDLLEEFIKWNNNHNKNYSRAELVRAVQRLLDRMIFIYFCEDHPDRLLPSELIKDVCENSIKSPGGSRHKVYDGLKQLFRDIDEGVDTDYWKIPKYNGELFKYHEIVDEIDLPDYLHTKKYKAEDKRGHKSVKGVWGLHVFDFWTELNRDLLGNIFEKSLSDLKKLEKGDKDIEVSETLELQKKFGIYYTASLLAKFLSDSIISETLEENENVQSILTEIDELDKSKEIESRIDTLFKELTKIKIADIACGSGVFLNSSLDNILRPYKKSLEARLSQSLDLEFVAKSTEQSKLVKSTIFGIDKLDQAVELTKLSLWLTSAKKDEPSSDLATNIIAGDSLNRDIYNDLQIDQPSFDVIIGNPPWGGEYHEHLANQILNSFNLNHNNDWDSWEIFIVLATLLLKEGGRLGFILPDTIHSSDKYKIREFLLNHYSFEKFYNLGPGWFGPDIRMGTVLFQGKLESQPNENIVNGLVLAGELRSKAIRGQIPLKQLETQLGGEISQDRFRNDDNYEFRVFCTNDDYELMERIDESSVELHEITSRSRGEEMNAEGHFWRCPNCHGYTVPGRKKKGGRYAEKQCPFCEYNLTDENTISEYVVSDEPSEEYDERYVDGKILNHRYQSLTYRWLNTDYSPIEPSFKNAELYTAPKILIRQAGVGITATLSTTDARCPQSVYIYRLNEYGRDLGYTEEFVLAALVSRVMNYYILKRYGEVDPARAHTKLTHSRLASLPIPEIEGRDQIVNNITNGVREMVNNNCLGSETDFAIESSLRELWGISQSGAYINYSFASVPESQSVKDLYPDGVLEAS